VALLGFILFCLVAFSFQRGIGEDAFSPMSSTEVANAGRGYIYAIFYLVALPGVLFQMNRALAMGTLMWPHTVLLLFSLFSAAWSDFPEKAALSGGHCLGIWLIALVTAFRWSSRREVLYRTFYFMLLLYFVVSCFYVFAVPAIGIRSIADATGEGVGRWQGIATHPNNFAYATVLLTWSSLAVLQTAKRWRSVFYMSILLVFLISALGARSMTATISNFALIAAYLVIPRPDAFKVRAPLLAVGAALVVTVLIVVLILSFDVGSSGGRNSLVFLGRDFGSMSGRMELWQMGWLAFSLKPLLGWSFDGNASFIRFAMGSFSFGQFHNGWVDIAVRGGMIGLILGVAVIVRFARTNLALSRIAPGNAWASWMFFLPFMIENLAEAQLLVPSSPLWGMFVALWAMNEYQVALSRTSRQNVL
jgi:O-antigen ligase